MKIVLVNPPLTTEERYGVHFQSGGMTPPLGLACLAAVLLKNNIEVKIIDGAISNDYLKVTEDIINEGPDYVGITASTVSIYNAANIAMRIKSFNHHITTIIGGPHITAVPYETMMRFASFDIGVIGEAENTIVELLRTKDLSAVDGIVYRKCGLVGTRQRKPIKNLDDLPMPAWELLPDPAKNYCPPVHTVKRLPAALLVTSRGCPGKCTFCDRSVFGNLSRAYSARYVMAMIRTLYYEYGIREIQFRDDNFLAFRPRVKELCNLLNMDKMEIVWSLAGRIDMVNPEVLNLLHSAGCWQIWYGIESGSQRVLDFINKKTKLDKIRQAVQWTKEAGIDVGGFFMMGIPTETTEDIEKTIRLSQELPLDEAHFTFFTPFPGCELHDTAHKYGKFDDDWKKTSCWNPVFVPEGMTETQLVRLWKKATMGFYMRPRKILNYASRVKSVKHVKVYASGLLALLESVFVKKYKS